MLFNSIDFLFFFGIVTTLYFVLPHRFRWLWLLLASCYFYMAFIPIYILILFATIIIDYVAALYIERSQGKQRKLYLWISIISTCLILFVFKYFNFFQANVMAVAQWLHWNYSLESLSIILPIGLSFHTFQSLSYVIEVYRGNQKAEKHFGIYSLYVMFYPQLVAGPIERPQNVLHQFHERHYFNPSLAVSGLKLMAWGMFKKVVIADNAAVLVNQVYNHPTDYEGISLLIATLLFAFQIYCDFSGYSDIAIGSARVMGFDLMKNFDRPYLSRSIGEFWRRWHISLSTWFRDYLYIPLGGNRVVKWRWYYNLFITFLISGVWHGANWTYVVWGALHGFYLVFALLTARTRDQWNQQLGLTHFPWLWKLLQTGTTFALVCLAWVFFRANTVSDAFYILTHMFTGIDNVTQLTSEQIRHILFLDQNIKLLSITLTSIALLLLTHWIERKGELIWLVDRKPVWIKWSLYYLLILAILFYGNFGQDQFIYFQF